MLSAFHSIQTLCYMIRNSIYRCYSIIPTIKEVFHLPSDLRLASQDTENDLMAMSFTVQRVKGGEVCVQACVCAPVCVRAGHSGICGFEKRPTSRLVLLSGESGGI